MRTNEQSITCILREKIAVANNTVTLCLETKSRDVFDFKPGQYVVVNVKDVDTGEVTGKMYTMTSAPGSARFNITVRKIGPFSRMLHNLEIDTEISVTGPYGELVPKEGLEQMICIASGIGIAPFYSMLEHYKKTQCNRPRTITVLYSNKTHADAAFLNELDGFAESLSGLLIVNTFTREVVEKGIGETGRIDEVFIKKYVPDIGHSDCFICGSIDFSDSMWRALTVMGVSDEHIFIETFY